MPDWLDPEVWEHGAKAISAAIDGLIRLRDALSRRRKESKPEDARVSALEADLQQVIELMTQHLESNRRVWESVVNLLGPRDAPEDDRPIAMLLKHFPLIRQTATSTSKLLNVVKDHEERLKALERDRREN